MQPQVRLRLLATQQQAPLQLLAIMAGCQTTQTSAYFLLTQKLHSHPRLRQGLTTPRTQQQQQGVPVWASSSSSSSSRVA
jgi:hypothetical protein